MRKEVRHETRCDHIPFYSPSGGKPSVLELEKSGRDAFDGRTVLAGGVCGRGWDGISEKKIKNASTLHCAGKGENPRCKCPITS